ncbi:MAG: T9SS type A sorting domain-containing protein, partial [Bacteroidota bacterium]|nr:T9SS type A sorting domain-containing protein [Bacteroidota bacterium]MDX5431687.1 T9SS type A sorting domain-containing protein [Bacteroidota bacterium]MDX5470402.1 T9SS type A sorting domain-containing protein [Bacteroidota bacterium]
YSFPGNVSSNEWWSDYPFIGLTDSSLMLSVLLWKDGDTGWETDAVDENIWQFNLEDGFAGINVRNRMYSGLSYGGKQIWNTRPVHASPDVYGPDLLLIGNRPKDIQNDTFFLIRVSGSWDGNGGQPDVMPLRSNTAYGLQPNVTQLGGRRLRTNYCDIQNAYFFNGNAYFCSNTIDFNTGRPAVYVGKIEDVLGDFPTVTGKIYGVDSLDLNYPSIAYAGAGWPDESSIIMCLHNSPNTYPGTSVFYQDRHGDFSDLLRLKEGEGMMNVLLSDSLERWGDYTGIQTDYSTPGSVWIAGSFGLKSGGSQTWIARVSNSDPTLSVMEAAGFSPQLYPNPAQIFTLEFEVNKSQKIMVELFDVGGKRVLHQSQDLLAGRQKLTLDPGLVSGVYFLKVMDENGEVIVSEKLILDRLR